MTCTRILIIEDDNDIRDTVEDTLRMEGYRVYSVCNGREAIRALREIPGPTLILLDMMMPLMNGWEFVEAQKCDARFANLPVVVVSALAADVALVKNSGLVEAQGYLRKPIELETLLSIVRLYCGTPQDEPALAEMQDPAASCNQAGRSGPGSVA